MIHHKIEQLIPFLSENFITYPLWEHGQFIPFINFWQKTDSEKDLMELDNKLKEAFEKSGYIVNYSDNNFSNTIHNYQVYPDFTDLENGDFEYVKKNWSIEEMLDLLWFVIK